MERRTSAVWFVLIGGLVGLLGDVLFYGKSLGLSVVLYASAVTGIVLALQYWWHHSLRWRNLWALIPLAFFAAMVAVRADGLTMMLDLLAVLALGGLTLHYLPLEQAIDEESFEQHGFAVLEAGMYMLPGAGAELAAATHWVRDQRLRGHGQLMAVGRGLLIALPVVVVFAILLGSADAMFANYLSQVWQVLTIHNAGDLFGQAVMTGALGWVAIGALAYGLARRLAYKSATPANTPPAEPLSDEAVLADMAADAERPPKRIALPFKLGMIEAGILLGSVDALFGAFVLVQFAYFFGGRGNINLNGYTYADYARRGFFELVAVSVLTLGLVLLLDWITVRDGQRQTRLFQSIAVVLVALTGVMLVSAAQRMWLYEEAYGFTHLRVYTHVFIAWLGVMFGFFLLTLFRVRKHIFSLGILLVLIGYLGTLNVMNVEGYIAEQNIARYHEGHTLDIAYLQSLSVDAVPAMVTLYQESADKPDIYNSVGQWLAKQLIDLDAFRAGEGATLFSANWSREQAWRLLDGMRRDLPKFDWQKYWQGQPNNLYSEF